MSRGWKCKLTSHHCIAHKTNMWFTKNDCFTWSCETQLPKRPAEFLDVWCVFVWRLVNVALLQHAAVGHKAGWGPSQRAQSAALPLQIFMGKTSQKHGDQWFQPKWLLLHPPMSSCFHGMMWTNVFSRFESIYSTNVHGFLDMRIYYHLWVDLHSESPQISKSNQPNLSFKLYQIVGVSWFSWLNHPAGKSSSTGNSISGICFRKI